MTRTRHASVRNAKTATTTIAGRSRTTITPGATNLPSRARTPRSIATPATPATACDAEAGQGLRGLPSQRRSARRETQGRLRNVPRPEGLALRHRIRPRSDRFPVAGAASGRELRAVPRDTGVQPDARARASIAIRTTTCTRAASARNARAAIRPTVGRCGMFDHAKETPDHFALLGAHAKLQCAECHHEPPGSTKMSPLCGTCHHKDDRHLGEYGAQCDRCHTNYSLEGRADSIAHETPPHIGMDSSRRRRCWRSRSSPWRECWPRRPPRLPRARSADHGAVRSPLDRFRTRRRASRPAVRIVPLERDLQGHAEKLRPVPHHGLDVSTRRRRPRRTYRAPTTAPPATTPSPSGPTCISITRK